MRRKGQRVRESSTERTHNARRYATMPGRPGHRSGRIPARPRTAWRCDARRTGHVRSADKPRPAAERCRADAVADASHADRRGTRRPLRERVCVREAWRGGCSAAAVIRLGVGHGNADGPCAAAGNASDPRERAFRGPAHAGPRSGGHFYSQLVSLLGLRART